MRMQYFVGWRLDFSHDLAIGGLLIAIRNEKLTVCDDVVLRIIRTAHSKADLRSESERQASVKRVFFSRFLDLLNT